MLLFLKAYENMKKRAKKAAADNKVQGLKTGGGAFDTQLTSTAEKLLTMLGNRATPLSNVYDSDATFNGTVWLPAILK